MAKSHLHQVRPSEQTKMNALGQYLKMACSYSVKTASTHEEKSVVCSPSTDRSTPFPHVKRDSSDTHGMLTKGDTQCHYACKLLSST